MDVGRGMVMERPKDLGYAEHKWHDEKAGGLGICVSSDERVGERKELAEWLSEQQDC